MASAAELSFNWLGFLTAMMSNLTFGFRAVWSKKAMADITTLGSTGVYAYTTLISVFICAPGVFIFEGAKLAAGIDNAIAILGAQAFYTRLLAVGVLYHLYNQFAFNTLGRVSPVSHGVCNVVKRIVIIGTSVVFFGNKLSLQTQIGTAIALGGTCATTRRRRPGRCSSVAVPGCPWCSGKRSQRLWVPALSVSVSATWARLLARRRCRAACVPPRVGSDWSGNA